VPNTSMDSAPVRRGPATALGFLAILSVTAMVSGRLIQERVRR
jgi:hypothetical protein